MRILALILLSLPAAAVAQDVDEPTTNTRKFRYAERTELDFDAISLTVELEGPSLRNITERRQPVHRHLFSPRTSFSEEMLESVSLVK